MDDFEHITKAEISFFLSEDDCDRKCIDACLEGIANRRCSDCGVDIIVFDTFFDYFIQNIVDRRIDSRVVKFYKHTHEGLETAHCFYNPSLIPYKPLHLLKNLDSLPPVIKL